MREGRRHAWSVLDAESVSMHHFRNCTDTSGMTRKRLISVHTSIWCTMRVPLFVTCRLTGIIHLMEIQAVNTVAGHGTVFAAFRLQYFVNADNRRRQATSNDPGSDGS